MWRLILTDRQLALIVRSSASWTVNPPVLKSVGECPELQNAVGRFDAAADVVAAAVPLVKADELGMALVEHGLAQHHRGIG